MLEAGRIIMEACVAAGGSLTGEHGIGLEKQDEMCLVFSDHDLEAMDQLRAAFDPEAFWNPGSSPSRLPRVRGAPRSGDPMSLDALTEIAPRIGERAALPCSRRTLEGLQRCVELAAKAMPLSDGQWNAARAGAGDGDVARSTLRPFCRRARA